MKEKVLAFQKIRGEMMKNREQVSQQLPTALRDKEEWRVRIYLDLKRKYCISKTSPESKEGALIQDELNKKLNEYKQKSFGWISKQAQKAKLNEIPPKESNQKKSAESIGKALILNSTYLVSKEDSEDFTRVIRCLGEEYKSRGLEFECTGPEPPHSFSSAK